MNGKSLHTWMTTMLFPCPGRKKTLTDRDTIKPLRLENVCLLWELTFLMHSKSLLLGRWPFWSIPSSPTIFFFCVLYGAHFVFLLYIGLLHIGLTQRSIFSTLFFSLYILFWVTMSLSRLKFIKSEICPYPRPLLWDSNCRIHSESGNHTCKVLLESSK